MYPGALSEAIKKGDKRVNFLGFVYLWN